MSSLPCFVRARDGALYKNPRIDFEEGFIDHTGVGARFRLAIWRGNPAWIFDLSSVLDRALGAGSYGAVSLAEAMRLRVPGTYPHQLHDAIVYTFLLSRRIPRPTYAEGVEKFASRIKPGSGIVLELGAWPLDAKELVAPKSLRAP